MKFRTEQEWLTKAELHYHFTGFEKLTWFNFTLPKLQGTYHVISINPFLKIHEFLLNKSKKLCKHLVGQIYAQERIPSLHFSMYQPLLLKGEKRVGTSQSYLEAMSTDVSLPSPGFLQTMIINTMKQSFAWKLLWHYTGPGDLAMILA